MLRNSCAVIVLAFFSIISLSSYAQAPPSADSYVTASQPAANFGNSSLLPVQAGTNSYVRLNLGALPANANVAKATLRLYVNAVAAPGSFDVYQVDGPWTERGLTWAHVPPLGGSATGGRPVSIAAASLNQFILIDVTPLVQGWLNGSIPNYGVALVLSGSNGSFSFDSKESSGTGHQPELEVIFANAASSPALSTTLAVAATPTPANQPPAPSAYIDNGTVQQVGASFNIDGSGTAAGFNAVSQYSLGGTRVLSSSGTATLSLGPSAGAVNTGAWNLFLGSYAGQSNSTGSYNTFTGALAGQNNTSGYLNTFIGVSSGRSNTSGIYNSFLGVDSGFSNTTGRSNTFLGDYAGYSGKTGSSNTFVGMNAGRPVVAGSLNTFLGFNAGSNADPAGSNNIYISHQGASGDSGTIRIGDPATQSAAYIAGINGAATNSGLPVFIDSTGKLGTDGGAISFSQMAGTLSSPQFNGTYSSSVTLSNATNSFTGSFAGYGGGLIGVSSGLSWPVVTKSADYLIQVSDFSTPTTYGSYLVLTGPVSHTFTLPKPPPANGSCVAIGNVADGGINSGTNVYLTVDPNGLNVDASQVLPTQARRVAYLYCSDGAGYYRLGYSLNGVSEIGPVLKTVDTGTPNVMKTTFRNGMDFGLTPGTMFYLLPVNNNTIANPTLNVNGLGAKRIVKFGNQGLAPNDLTTVAYAHIFYDGTTWQLLNPQTNQGTVTSVSAASPLISTGGTAPTISCPSCVTTAVLNGTTESIGGVELAAGSCTVGTASVVGATVGHPVSVSASDGSLPNALIILSAAVTSQDTVTVQLCAVGTVTPSVVAYNVATQ